MSASVDNERPRLSVIVPAHNSAAVIGRTIAELVGRLDETAEVILVENGSTDDTYVRCVELARSQSVGVPHIVVLRSERGYGNALRAGTLASRGTWVLITADDLPFRFDDLDAFQRMASERDVALIVGSKAHPGSKARRGALRRTLTAGFGLLRRAVLGMKVGDPQGTLIVEGGLVREIVGRAAEPGFLFTTELVYLLERAGVDAVEVPVRLRSDHGQHASRVKPRDVVEMTAGLFRVRRRHRRGRRMAAGTRSSTTRAARIEQSGSERAPAIASAGIAAASTDSPPHPPSQDGHGRRTRQPGRRRSEATRIR